MALNMWKNARDVVDFDAGQVIFKEGDAGDVMYAVVEGEVEISRGGVAIERLGEGGVFGELALVDDSTRGATATAAVSSRLARVDRKQFTFLVHEHPTFALQVMSTMANRLRAANERG